MYHRPFTFLEYTTEKTNQVNLRNLSNRTLLATSIYSSESLPIDDACFALSNATSFKDKIVLIRRGNCTFAEKARNAESRGALAVIIYDNMAGSETLVPSLGGDERIKIPIFGINSTSGLWLVNQIRKQPGTVRWNAEMQIFNNPTGKLASKFSSLGLSADLSLKPEIGAPGNLY